MRDVSLSLWGALVFGFALVAPGYCIGRAGNLLSFREQGLREQLAWSVALSFALGTLPLVAVVWIGGVWMGALAIAACGLAGVLMLLRRGALSVEALRITLPFLVLASVWVLLIVGSLVDVGIGSRLWMSVTSYDHSLRTAFVDAVMRTGVPPANPAYWPGHDAPMRYYYFWYVVCAVVGKLAHISARQAFIASCVWPFFGLAAMLALYGRYLLEWRGRELQRRWWTAVALMSVTGLDALVVLALWLTGGGSQVFGDMEWWSVDQVSSWLDTFLWVPHHAAALVCCLLCVLLLYLASEESMARTRFTLAVAAGISFGSAFGLSVYVAVGTAFVLTLWVLWRLLHADRWRVATSCVLASVTALVALGPYLVQLLRPQQGANASAGHVLGFGVRHILQPYVLYGFPGLHSLQFSHSRLAAEISALILLLPSYGVELGFFAVVLLASWKLWRGTAGERTLLFLTFAGWVSASFLRSQVIATNDYSIRASLLPQFMLLPLGALALQSSRRFLRGFLVLLVVVGVSGTVYQAVILRTYLPWHQAHGDSALADLSEYNFAVRDAYSALDRQVPPAARVQFSVNNDEYFQYAQMLNVGRQVIADSSECNTSFGGELTPCAHIQYALHRLYPDGDQPAPSGVEAAALCSGIGAQYLVAVRWDDVWDARQSWVWSLPVVVERPDVRVVRCTAMEPSR